MDDVTNIRKLEEALRTAMLANDADALSELMDDSLVFTGLDGQVLSKNDDLSVHRSGRLRLDRLDLYDIQIHRIGESFVTTTKAILAGHFGSTPFGGVFAYTRVWRQSGALWQIVVGHASRIE